MNATIQTPQDTPTPPRNRPRARIPEQLRTAAVLGGLWFILMITTAVTHPDFLSRSTFLAIAFNMVVPGAVALGLSFVTISGALLDLSSGVTVATASVVCATLLRQGTGTAVAVLGALAAGLIIGLINAALVVGVGINPIVATLATSFAGGGLLVVYTAQINEFVPADAALHTMGLSRILGVPDMLVVLVVLTVIGELALVRTRPGRRLVAVGGNKRAASARGISIRRVRLTAFLLSGALAALGGVFLAAQSTTVASTTDPQLAYRVAAIVLVGGISLTGGRGRVTGLFASLLLLSSIPTMIVQFGVSSSWQAILEGAALFVAVSLDARRFGARR